MRKHINFAAAVAFAVVAITGWSYASIHSDAALKMSGPMLVDAQIDVLQLTRTAQHLPSQQFAAY